MRLLLFAKITFIFFLTQLFAFAVETRMAYSDLISDSIQEVIYSNTISLDRDFNADITNLSITKSGSLPIIEDFLSDRLDLCILALPEESEFPVLESDEIIKIPFGYISSVIVVNSENPKSEITIDELATIFGDSSANSNLLSWRDFGMSSFSTSFIKAFAVNEADKVSTDLFRHSVLEEKLFNSSITLDDENKVVRMISQDKAAIGIFPSNPQNANLKVLFVAQDEESIAYGPSNYNIYYSDYPIRLPFYIVYNVSNAEKLYPLINILLSDLVADNLEKDDVYSIPKVIREKLLIDLQMYLEENKD